MSKTLKLHGFFLSSAAYRVRIALALKGLRAESVSINLRAGAQHDPTYVAINPANLVPALVNGDHVVTQSLAIIDYLDHLQPEPLMVPAAWPARSRVLEIALLIACDIHPLNNMRVMQRLAEPMQVEQAHRDAWYAYWIQAGFTAVEALLLDRSDWCVGDAPTLADCCLVPQYASAIRMKMPLDAYPRMRRIYEHACVHPAFASAAPEMQSDSTVSR